MAGDFWERLVEGHTQTTVPDAVDQRISARDFGAVQALTDKGKEARAFELPVSAGTRVAFVGNLGSVLAYEDPPENGLEGEVVTVRSASGDITAHDGKVFVKWDDGVFRSVYAQHLRKVSAPEEKQSSYMKEFLSDLSIALGLDGEIDDDLMSFGSWWLGKKIPTRNLDTSEVKRYFSIWKRSLSARTASFSPQINQIRVAGLGDLTAFLKLADDKLIHKSTKDLWSFKKNKGGELVVSRLFNPNGEPLKG